MARNVSRRGFLQGLAAVTGSAKMGALGKMAEGAAKAIPEAAPQAAERLLPTAFWERLGNHLHEMATDRLPDAVPESLWHEAEGVSHLYDMPNLTTALVDDAAKYAGLNPKQTSLAHGLISQDFEHLDNVYQEISNGYHGHLEPEDLVQHAISDDGRILAPDAFRKHVYRFPGLPNADLEDLHRGANIHSMAGEQHDEAMSHFLERHSRGDMDAEESAGLKEYWAKHNPEMVPVLEESERQHAVGGPPLGDYDPVDEGYIKDALARGDARAALNKTRFMPQDGKLEFSRVWDLIKRLFPDEGERTAVAQKLTTPEGGRLQIEHQPEAPTNFMRWAEDEPVPVKREDQ